jgi:hypothetical protein
MDTPTAPIRSCRQLALEWVCCNMSGEKFMELEGDFRELKGSNIAAGIKFME